MSETRRLQAPLAEANLRSLKVGDELLVASMVYAARDMAHRRLCEAMEAGRELPFELAEAVLHFVGPTPAPQGRVIGAASHTTSSRTDPFSPKLIANALRAMMRKGYRGDQVGEDLGAEAVRRLQVVDFPAVAAYDCYGHSVYKTGRVTK
jgi:fumarate hydratase subunit beta